MKDHTVSKIVKEIKSKRVWGEMEGKQFFQKKMLSKNFTIFLNMFSETFIQKIFETNFIFHVK